MSSMLAILIGSIVIAVVALVVLGLIVIEKFIDYSIGIDDDFASKAKTKPKAR